MCSEDNVPKARKTYIVSIKCEFLANPLLSHPNTTSLESLELIFHFFSIERGVKWKHYYFGFKNKNGSHD
jgi:hypothetical protein